ncbi:MAG: YchJ family metal-binding protein [Chlamydiota bacterium]
MPTTDKKNFCLCCSGFTYTACCQPFHDGQLPENALKLMRSRFTAYALNLPEYIMETTHPESPQFSRNRASWRRSISQFSTASTFARLKIIAFEEHKHSATVTFTAYIYQGTNDCTFTEKSFFQTINCKWLYYHGEIL